MAFRLLLAFALLAAASTVALCAAPLRSERDPRLTLRRVVFTHRHGARTPMKNLSHACDEIGCGTLTPEGQGMLESLGKNFLRRYGAAILQPSGAGDHAVFDLRRVKMTSDDSPRVIQSAGAFWRGLFGANSGATVNGGAHVPFITTDSGLLIDPWAQPGPSLHTRLISADIAKNLTQRALAMLSNEVVMAVAKEIGQDAEECQRNPMSCIMTQNDYLLWALSAGKLAQYPVAAAHMATYATIKTLVSRYHEGVWDQDVARTGYFSSAGWPGTVLANAMLRDAVDGALVLSEFSAHDGSLLALYAALGDLNFVYPEFGTALVLEVYEGPGGAGGELFVSALLGKPQQTPDGGWPYQFDPYTLRCINATTGAAYAAPAGCPLADLSAYVESRMPRSPSGFCWAWPDDLRRQHCEPDEAADVSSRCGEYRAACPFEACGTKRRMTADLRCVKG